MSEEEKRRQVIKCWEVEAGPSGSDDNPNPEMLSDLNVNKQVQYLMQHHQISQDLLNIKMVVEDLSYNNAL